MLDAESRCSALQHNPAMAPPVWYAVLRRAAQHVPCRQAGSMPLLLLSTSPRQRSSGFHDPAPTSDTWAGAQQQQQFRSVSSGSILPHVWECACYNASAAADHVHVGRFQHTQRQRQYQLPQCGAPVARISDICWLPPSQSDGDLSRCAPAAFLLLAAVLAEL